MSDKIGVDVQAKFDSSGLNSGVQKAIKEVDKLDDALSGLSKKPIDLIPDKAVKNISAATAKLQQLLRVDGELRRKVKATGADPSKIERFDQLPFEAAYPNPTARKRKYEQVQRYLSGDSGDGAGPGGSGTPKAGSAFREMTIRAAQSGLRATGSAGGVAASALGTGASAGFGAGLMGLMGGMLALGVGKLVGSAAEKVGQAEDDAVAMDTLKRTLGDVNVSFDALKSVVDGGAQNLKITYNEATKLSTQFAKLGNLTGDQYKSLAGELDIGVGMSRGFGLDPSQGVGVMGQMRGLGITTNTQESRRFAMLIGETIGKAGAFAKADEMMDAITGYATSQTKNNLGEANTAEYSGMLSAMVGSGKPGLDVSNSAAILARMGATLSAGGGAGEASQFFTGMVGNRLGLSPIQTEMLAEAGPFATKKSVFGDGSAAADFGIQYPGGGNDDKTFFQATMEMLQEKYGNNKEMFAAGAKRHLGLGYMQAMRISKISPNEIGEMQNYGDISKLSGSGITSMSKSLYGTGEDRQAIARTLLGRKDVAQEDKAKIEAAMGTSKEREVLATLTMQYDQERTQGSDIRDSKNALDNIKMDMAGKVVPYLNEMRMGIMHLAGYDKGKTSEQIMKEVIQRDSEGRAKSISGRFASVINPLEERKQHLLNKERSLDPAALSLTYRDKPEVLAEKLKERADVQRELGEIDKKLKDLSEEKAELLKKENARRDTELKQMEKDAADRATEALTTASVVPSAGGGRGFGYNPNAKDSGKTYQTGGSATPMDTSSVDGKLAEAEARTGLPPGILKSIIKQETGGDKSYLDDPAKYHYPLNSAGRRIAPHTGKVSTAFGPFGILESTAASPGFGVSPLKDKGADEQIRFASEYLSARIKSAGSVKGGLDGYGEPGGRYSASVLSRMNAGTQLPESDYRPGAVQSAPLPPLTGEMSVRLDMGPGLEGLIRPKGPMSTRFGPARAQ